MFHWWEEDSLRFHDELAAFSRHGASVVIDTDDQVAGSLVLRVNWPVNGEGLDLIVRYPHHFPFFRPAVAAPGLSLRYHQEPYTGDLCLLPQWSGAWLPEDRVADYIYEQLPKVLDAGSTDEKEKVSKIEVHQAEPRSGYYRYVAQAFLLSEGAWKIPQSVKSGYLVVGIEGGRGQSPTDSIRKGIRAAILDVQDQSGRTIEVLNQAVAHPYSGTVFKGHWVRLSKPPKGIDERCFWDALRQEYPKLFSLVEKKASKNEEGVIGFIFPEEADYRGASSDGWVFLNYFGINK